MPGDSGVTVVTNSRVFYTTREAAGASGARHSLRPLIAVGQDVQANLARASGEIAKLCLPQSCCLKIEATIRSLLGRIRVQPATSGVPRFAEDKVVAVVLALPEPFAVLALMNRRIERGDRQNLIAPDEASLVAEAFEIGKYILDIAGREVPIFALENQQGRVLSQNPLGALQNPEFGALDVDLEQREPVALAKIIVQRDHWHGQGCEAFRFQRRAMKRRAGLMAFWQKQVPIAGLRIDGFGFNLDVAKLYHAEDVLEIAGQLRLWLERDHPAIPHPPREPVDEAALVGADITGDIARPKVPPDKAELGSLIAKQGLQRPGPKPDTLGRKPGLEDGHRSAFRFCAVWPAALLRRGFGGHPVSQFRRMPILRSASRETGWWGKKDSNLRSHKTADLQSAPFATRDTPPLNSIATHPPKWRRQGHG